MLIGIQTTSLYTIDCYKTLTTDSLTAQCRMGWPPCRMKMMGRHKLQTKTSTGEVQSTRFCHILDTCRLIPNLSISKIRPNLDRGKFNSQKWPKIDIFNFIKNFWSPYSPNGLCSMMSPFRSTI